ncbi:MAG: 30S ribosomal protein S20 [Leptospira sp.]|nr:30S ribosomal protein S20 [Leptospira sp.]
MANLKSSKKDIRRTIKRTELNSQKKSRIRTFAKNIVKSIKAGEIEKVDGLYRDYSSLLDKAAKTNLIHARNADRKKSRMALFISKNKQSQASAQA